MSKEQLMGRLLTATPSELKKIEAVFSGKDKAQPETGDRRLYNIQQAARELNISRTSVWRLLKSGRLPFVELRKGSRRIPSEAITALVKGGAV